MHKVVDPERVLPTPTVTKKLVEMIKNEYILVYVVDNDILKETAELFNPVGSKQNTFIDCSVAVIAKKLNANAVFTYDGFYAKQGLRLAQEL